MEVQNTHFNIKTILDVKIKIQQTEVLMWQYISTSTIIIYFYIMKQTFPHCIDSVKFYVFFLIQA